MGRRVRSLAVAALALGASACGGGAPLLHPAHVLPLGRFSAGAGVSGQFAFRTDEPRRAPGTPTEQRGLEDAVERTSLSPGIAPWVGVRAGIGGHFETGVVYTGRSLRADVRRAFGGESVAVSVGAAVSAAFSDPPDRSDSAALPMSGRIPSTGPDAHANGYGFDVPVLLGWRSTASIVQGWVGVRGGAEHLDGELPLERARGPDATLAATRWYGGGLVGAALGLAPLTIAVELDVAYQGISARAEFPGAAGPPGAREAHVGGVTVAPAGALIGKF